jgi:hypothetical protein
MDLGVKVEELQNWIGNVRAGCLFKPVVILLMVSTLLGLSYGLKAVLRDRKSSEVFLNDNQGGASVELSWSQRMPAEDDIMEAFDAFDYKRLGFIDRATVNHVLGHMALPGHLDAAAPFLGSVKKLFYDDFRRLAQQPGPFADVVTHELVSDKRERQLTLREELHLMTDAILDSKWIWLKLQFLPSLTAHRSSTGPFPVPLPREQSEAGPSCEKSWLQSLRRNAIVSLLAANVTS